MEPSERDEVVGRLKKLKMEYGKFIWMSPREIDALTYSAIPKVFDDSCFLPRTTIPLDYRGDKKPKCVMGAEADCYRCGCTVPTMMHSYSKGDVEALYLAIKSFL